MCKVEIFQRGRNLTLEDDSSVAVLILQNKISYREREPYTGYVATGSRSRVDGIFSRLIGYLNSDLYRKQYIRS